MVDLSGNVGAPGRWSRRLGARFRDGLAAELSPAVAYWLALALAASMLVWFWRTEGELSNVVFTAAVTVGVGAAIVAATRRLLFATISVALVVGMITGIAMVKQKTLGMVLHAYDIVFYLGSWSTITYLWFAARSYVVMLLLGMSLTGLLGWIAWRCDATRASRRHAVLVLALAAGVTAASGLAKPERRQMQFYWDALFVSSFYSSWAETVETLWRGQLIEAAHAAAAGPFGTPDSCKPAQKPPHIVLIHQESVVQPGLFPGLAYDRGVDPFFYSHDGRLHHLGVETYGGASWLTEFSVLTGLSTHSFGGMRPFVQSLLAGKVHDTIPEALSRCGYRNVLFYPMLKNFVSNARFYDAIGIKEIFDLKAQGAKTESERDRFYYDNAMAEMERHVKTSSKPLFTYIQTMSAHWPYDYAYEPDMKVPGGGPGTDPEMHEYLRRLSIAKLDYDYLKAELKHRLPGEPILIVHYGDHHPMATRKLLGFGDDTEVEEVTIGPQSIGFTTYFAVEALGFAPPAMPESQTVDVPYLGAVMLQQAGLPMSPSWRERLRLLKACDGRYHTCQRRTEILSFHRRLIDSRLIDQR